MKITGFVWLEEVVDKLQRKHGVEPDEVEEALIQKARIRRIETGKVQGEDLYAGVGRTAAGRQRGSMAKSKSHDRDPIPAEFASLAEAAEFWDTHDLAIYADQTQEVDVDVKIDRRVFLTALEPGLARKVSAYAMKQGVRAETLINIWLSEKLAAATSGK